MMYMKNSEYLLNGRPVTILESAGRGQVWVRTADDIVMSVWKSGLSTATTRPVAAGSLRIDNSRGTDGAR